MISVRTPNNLFDSSNIFTFDTQKLLLKPLLSIKKSKVLAEELLDPKLKLKSKRKIKRKMYKKSNQDTHITAGGPLVVCLQNG